MTTFEISRRTLLDCQSEGKLSQSEALGYAVSLAQELSRLHGAGRIHGGLSPAVIVLTETGVELLPAVSDGEVTPYTAPEVLTGAPSDVLSDIFSFGAVVYEMLAGVRAFDGDCAEAIAYSIAETQPTSCGGPALDRLIQTCLAKEPSARFQRVDKILMQLKLASIAARCGQAPAMTRWELADLHLESNLRGVQQSQQEQAAMIDAIQADLKRTEGLAEAQQQQAAAIDAIQADLKRTEALAEAQQQQAAAIDAIQADLKRTEALAEAQKQQAAAIDALRIDMKRTEGLLEWVVEILEVLQSNVLDQPPATVVNGVNGVNGTAHAGGSVS